MLHSWASFCRFLSVSSDAPVRSAGFTPGRSSPGACAVPLSAPDAPFRAVFLTYSLRCLGRSSLWHRAHPRTIQSGGYCRASCRPGCSHPGRLFIVLSPLPRTLQSVAPVSPPDVPVGGLVPCLFLPRVLQSCLFFYCIPSVASDAPVRGTGFTPGRSSPRASAVLLSAPDAPNRAVVLCFSLRCLGCSSPGRLFVVFSPLPLDAPVRGTRFPPGRFSPGASAVLHSAPDAPIRGVFLSYSLRCLGRSSPWHRVHPRTIQSSG